MKMTVQCQCSKLTGTLEDVSPQTVNRFVCYCNDCQAFAHFLDREADVLDAHGGTEIMQMAPSHLKFTGGQDHIACMRLSDKGIYRWYSRCCNTPIANTGGFKLPFVGLTHNCVHPSRDCRSNSRIWRCARSNARSVRQRWPEPRPHAPWPVGPLSRCHSQRKAQGRAEALTLFRPRNRQCRGTAKDPHYPPSTPSSWSASAYLLFGSQFPTKLEAKGALTEP